ncbi:MAG: hypothetical protein EBY20_02415 [Alphaproteobacteria bacterium]|uniref:Uncharacterized protein n=1 Tax=viral metagenome TaxID=1070528 RepID=A0A6C0HQQ1_9ZZZZ|nr:hypothetical protein [Alphaproteobacteria bacterium]
MSSSLFKTTKYVNFHNSSELPIMVDSWIDGSNSLRCLRVGPQEKLVIHSSVGEWHVNSMLVDEADYKPWREGALKWYVNLGKFRSDPCVSGDYAWMEWEDIFDCVYSECAPTFDPRTKEPIVGLVTFVFKGLPKPSS